MLNIGSEYVGWLQMYEFEGFLTVRLPRNIHPLKAQPQIIEDVLRPLSKFLKTRIAAISVFSYGHPGLQLPHVHALLLSKSQQLTTRISEAQDFLKFSKEKHTQLNTHRAAIMLLPFIAERHLHYTADHIIADADVNYYDKKLLASLKTTGAIQ